MTLRKATSKDTELTYSWAKDPLVRQNSYSHNEIEREGHKTWFLKKLEDENALFLIFEDEGIAVGLVRFERMEDHFVIGITVAPEQRGKGYASQMLKQGVVKYSGKWELPVHAYIKIENLVSVKAFEGAGFTFSKDLEYLGTPSKLYIWK